MPNGKIVIFKPGLDPNSRSKISQFIKRNNINKLGVAYTFDSLESQQKLTRLTIVNDIATIVNQNGQQKLTRLTNVNSPIKGPYVEDQQLLQEPTNVDILQQKLTGLEMKNRKQQDFIDKIIKEKQVIIDALREVYNYFKIVLHDPEKMDSELDKLDFGKIDNGVNLL